MLKTIFCINRYLGVGINTDQEALEKLESDYEQESADLLDWIDEIDSELERINGSDG